MASVDEIVAALAEMPAAERAGWRFADTLSRLDEPVRPPEKPIPDWFRQGVERAVRRLAASWPQRPLFHPIRALDRAGIVTPPHDDTYILAMISALGDRGDAAYRLDAIRTDDALRERLLWRVFEVEGGGEISLANVDKHSMPGSRWSDAFRTLVADGTLPRDRVLQACLAALGRDFSAYRAGFHSRLFDSLEPTAAELAAAQPTLLRLLSSTVPATVSMAVRHLATMDRDHAAFLDACPPALVVPAKNTPLTILRLLRAVAADRPGQAAEVAAIALEHRHRDVQKAALTLLRDLDADDLVTGRLGLLEPSVARQAAEWFGLTRDDEPPAPEPMSEAKPFPRTPSERAAALLAGDTDPWEIEQFLAEVATGRAATELRKPARRALQHYDRVRHLTAALLLNEPAQLHHAGFLAARVREIGSLTGPRVLLATPTDPSGWLDPPELVRRLKDVAFVGRLKDTAEPMRHDLIAALLRLHLDGRPEALRDAHSLPGDVGAAVRYALGGDPAPIGDPAVWVAAARTRAPFDDDPHLIAYGLTGAGRGHAARLTLRLTSETHRYQDGTAWRTFVTWEPHIDVEPPVVRSADQPTVPAEYGPSGELLRWQAQIWPHDAEAFLAPEIQPAMWAEHGDSTRLLEALLAHPGRLGPMAAAVVAASLTAQEPACRLRAAEALTTLVPHRIPVTVMADAMALLAGHATATRWAAALRDTGNPHVVIAVLGALLPQLPHSHPGLHALVVALLEESLRVSAVPPPELRPWLLGFTGSSKAARAARDLLELAPA